MAHKWGADLWPKRAAGRNKREEGPTVFHRETVTLDRIAN